VRLPTVMRTLIHKTRACTYQNKAFNLRTPNVLERCS